ncbi:MAG: hypothetical protein MJ223_03590 [Mycoplasmoidaceae bacterium]|nr:hypothetical protein [Mycoplasmoidaceae bacterium]
MIVVFGAAIAALIKPEWQESTKYIFKDYNLPFHVINPIIAILSFLFLENTNKIKLKQTTFSLIVPFIYSIFYLILSFSHLANGSIDPTFDPYQIFAIVTSLGLNVYVFVPFVLIFFIGFSYLIT